MKKNLVVCLFLFLFSTLTVLRGDGLFPTEKEPLLIVRNRILARINNKVITTHDVMKKMDMLFYKHYPEYATSLAARYEFYQISWKPMLDELITKELILSDATVNKVEVSNGDVRQEMEMLFGPNIISNLAKVDLTFDEAFKIIQGDLIIRRMMGARVNGKAVRLLTPALVRKTYEEYISDPNNLRPTVWRYQVVTIRDKTNEQAEETAQEIYRMLVEENIPLDKIQDTLNERELLAKNTKVTISDEITNHEKELSDSYKAILVQMNNGMYSLPSSHKSRTDKRQVYRIFFVKEKVPGGYPTFAEMEPKCKDKLLGEIVDQESEKYLTKLKRHFHVTDKDLAEMIPEDYKPFEVKFN